MSDLLPCPFCGGEAIMPYYGDRVECRECKGSVMTIAAWNTRVASHPATSTPVVDQKQAETSDNDLVERVARAIWHCGFHPDDVASGEADRRKADWPDDWHKAVNKAQAAISAIDLPGQREAAARAALEAALRQFSMDPEALDEPDYVDFVFDCIRAIDPKQFAGGGNATGK